MALKPCITAVAALALAAASPSFAQDDYSDPAAAPAVQKDIPIIDTSRAAHHFDEVKFVTGGVGDDERAEIEAAKADYNVYITSAGIGGEFIDDARVILRNGTGEEVLDVEAGPLLYVALPPGKYTLEATLGEQVKTQKLTIGKKAKPTRVHLGWKPEKKVE